MLKKPVKIFIIFSIIILVFSILFIALLTFKSIPNYNRVVTSSFVEKDVKIIRNDYAIPNIIGQSNEDTFYALGYVHAQDRLWQMILLRKTAKGKLSEIFGEDYLETDKFIRTLDIYNNSQKSFNSLSKKTKNILVSYSKGINKRFSDIKKEGLGRGSPILFMFPPRVSPWTPADSMAILKLQDLLNNKSAKNEVIKLNLLNTGISYDRLLDIYPDLPEIQNINDLLNINLFSKQNIFKNFNSDNQSEINFTRNINSQVSKLSNASNSWAALGSRTATGNTLVGHNLHTNFDIPINWMLVKLVLETGPVVGATIPGIPLIFNGRSQYFSWGISSSKLDNQDLVIEVLNTKNNNEYKSKNGFKEFKSKNILIEIKDKPGITHKILSSENGPILPVTAYGIKSIQSDKIAVALKWTGLSKNDKSLESLLNIMLSTDIKQAKKSLDSLIVPAYNILFAEKNKVQIISAGKIPNRDQKNPLYFGAIPSLGISQSKNWTGNLDFSQLSEIEIQNNGVIYNTNNKLSNNEFPLHISYDLVSNHRFFRMQNLFAKREYHTLESFEEIQIDNISPSARILIPLLAKDLWYSQVLEIDNKFLNLRKEAIDLLAEWNGEMSIYLPQPLIFYTWAAQFQKMVMQDEIGKNVNWFNSVNSNFLERVLRNINGASAWCDIKQTSKLETCEEISSKALDNALVTIANKYGQDIKKWLWGNYHKAYFSDKVLGKYPIISYLTNIVFEVSGGDDTLSMNRAISSTNNNYNVNYGSTLRIIIDFSDNANNFFSIPTGQSGHFLSKHYDDFTNLWLRNEYVKIPLFEDEILNKKIDLMLITKSVD